MASEEDVTKVELRAATNNLQAAVDDLLAGPEKAAVDTSEKRIIEAAEKILRTVKPAGHWQWIELIRNMAVMGVTHLFQEWGAFDLIPQEGAITFSQLSQKLDAETLLIERLCGVLISTGTLRFVGTDSVAHTPQSRALVCENPVGVVYRMCWDNSMVAYFHLANFFDKYGRKEPQAINHIPATFARGQPDKSFFEVLANDPAYFKRFSDGMAIVESMSPAVPEGMYDFSWLVKKAEQEPERTVFIDVGGGLGHCILAVNQEFPGIPLDRCVLQERAEVIKTVEADPKMAKVQKQVVNFHVAQPNKGAMVYFIRKCLHNYSDTLSVNILRILAEAMADDSRILIQEDIKSTPPGIDSAQLDFLMLSYGGKERTRQCWEDIVERAGLKISAVSGGNGPLLDLFVIECVKNA